MTQMIRSGIVCFLPCVRVEFQILVSRIVDLNIFLFINYYFIHIHALVHLRGSRCLYNILVASINKQFLFCIDQL